MNTDRLRRELERMRREYEMQQCKLCSGPITDYDISIEWEEPDEDEIPPEPCPECGRMPQVIDVGWGD